MNQSKKLSDFKKLLSSVEVVCFDCDGVLYHGPDQIPGVPETLEGLKKLGKSIFFVTNNSTKSREENMKKLANFGITGIQKDQIICSSFSAAHYLEKNEFQKGEKNKVYVIGEQGIEDELREHGIECLGTEHNGKVVGSSLEIEVDEKIGCVVVGLDRQFNYFKMSYGLVHIQNGAEFIATNRDSTFPAGKGVLLPGAGSIVSAMETCCHKEPKVMGKPSKWFIQVVQDVVLEKISPCTHPFEKVLMIGDRLDTDIEFGNAAGFKTLLVTKTGVNNETHLKDANCKPTFYTDKVTDFLPHL